MSNSGSHGAGASASSNLIHGMSDSKLISFALGQQKKSRFQKAREEREAKRRAEERDTAEVYESFVASFEDSTSSSGREKIFVRSTGGGSGPSSSATFSASMASAPTQSDIDKDRAAMTSKISKPVINANLDDLLFEMKQDNSRLTDLHAAPEEAVQHRSTKTRQIDALLNEMKAEGPKGQPRGARSRYTDNKYPSATVSTPAFSDSAPNGSHDNGDGTTTNLYVGNLSPDTTEEQLQALFATYGEVESVKIMWPRSDEERIRKRNCGFVNFQRREDADQARMDLHDHLLHGYKMIVGWGKALRSSSSSSTSQSVMTNCSKQQSNGSMSSWDQQPEVTTEVSLDAGANNVYPVQRDMISSDVRVEIVIPRDRRVKELIDLVAHYVSVDGEGFLDVRR